MNEDIFENEIYTYRKLCEYRLLLKKYSIKILRKNDNTFRVYDEFCRDLRDAGYNQIQRAHYDFTCDIPDIEYLGKYISQILLYLEDIENREIMQYERDEFYQAFTNLEYVSMYGFDVLYENELREKTLLLLKLSKKYLYVWDYMRLKNILEKMFTRVRKET